MLNPSTNERELAYIVRVDNISAMDADNLECAHVRGWNCVVGKGEFEPGDLAIYFEIDAKVPEVEPFTSMDFLKSKDYKIKSQKIRGVCSQGLLMPASAFGWSNAYTEGMCGDDYIITNSLKEDILETLKEGDFLTERLQVTYAVAEDNTRKAITNDKYKAMAQRNSKYARTAWWKWLYKRMWGKKLLFLFFGKKRDINKDWPSWVVKTDEERCQNLFWDNYKGTEHWIVTEKIDGTSSTFTMKRGKETLFGKEPDTYLVCSRNVVFDKPDKKCYYDTNYYQYISDKYCIEMILSSYLNENPDINWVTLQGEIYGKGVQKRDYSIDHVDFMGFNFIDSKNGRWGSLEADTYFRVRLGVPWVPILRLDMKLPETVDEMVKFADGNSLLDGEIREGVVIRSQDGKQSFKVVSNNYLLKKNG